MSVHSCHGLERHKGTTQSLCTQSAVGVRGSIVKEMRFPFPCYAYTHYMHCTLCTLSQQIRHACLCVCACDHLLMHSYTHARFGSIFLAGVCVYGIRFPFSLSRPFSLYQLLPSQPLLLCSGCVSPHASVSAGIQGCRAHATCTSSSGAASRLAICSSPFAACFSGETEAISG